MADGHQIKGGHWPFSAKIGRNESSLRSAVPLPREPQNSKKKPKNLTGKFRTWASYETSNGHRLFDVTCLTGNLGGETHGLWAKPFAATAAYRAKEKAL